MQHPSLLGSTADNVIWYLPYGLEVLILTIVFLGFAWSVLVCLVTFRPRTWVRISAKKDDGQSAKQRSWCERLVGAREQERRPLDKPSKYALQYSVSFSHMGNTSDTATTSSSHALREDRGLEMERRPQHRRHHSATETPHQDTSSTTTLRSPHSSTPPSPPNPFLHPPGSFLSSQQPLHTRSSSDWLAQRATSFSTTTSSADALATADMLALEAGTAPQTPRSMSKHERQRSWVDLGLARVEDAVSGFVGRVARWTDDGNGEEALLPVVNGRREVRVR